MTMQSQDVIRPEHRVATPVSLPEGYYVNAAGYVVRARELERPIVDEVPRGEVVKQIVAKAQVNAAAVAASKAALSESFTPDMSDVEMMTLFSARLVIDMPGIPETPYSLVDSGLFPVVCDTRSAIDSGVFDFSVSLGSTLRAQGAGGDINARNVNIGTMERIIGANMKNGRLSAEEILLCAGILGLDTRNTEDNVDAAVHALAARIVDEKVALEA